MASGLCLLGRGGKRRPLYAVIHIVFAGLGGGITGLSLGAIGLLLPVSLREAVAVGFAALAVYRATRPAVSGTGLRRQVARRLEGRLNPLVAYAVWGAELGSGLSTVIPYSAFLWLLGIEFVSGPALGAAAGAGFGLIRQGAAALVAYQSSPAPIMAFLPRLAVRARLANVVVCLAGSTALITEIVR